MKRFFSLVLAGSAILVPHAFAQNLDLIIRGGSLMDGSGSPATKADIGIEGNRIVFVGNSAGRKAKREIDATGLVVTPGFIDPHTHTASDLSDPKRSRNDAYLMQGVTTVATGNDGDSPTAIGATLAKWGQQGIGTNAALFIGQGTVRREVMGMSDAKPTAEQLDRMKALVDAAMKEGAIGMSTGLITRREATPVQKKSSSWRASQHNTAASTTPTCATKAHTPSACSVRFAKRSA